MRNRICLMLMLLVTGLVILPCFGEPPAKQVLTPAPENSFSIVVIPDTQMYHGEGTKRTPKSKEPVTNTILESQTRWIAENLEPQRIAFVSHVGDIIDRNNDSQWTVARKWMDLLHGKVPYGISPGNHDMTRPGDSSLFQKYFGAERFKDFDWYGGCYSGDPKHPGHSGDNANSYQLFSAEGLDFVVLHLECNAPNGVLKWADSILRKYPDRIAIVTTHMYLGELERHKTIQETRDAPKGVMQWKKNHYKRGNTPQQMWEKCFKKHANLRMIFCGDQSRCQAIHLTQKGDHGNTVHALLSDYGTGQLRIYRFLPSENKVEVITYDTIRKQLEDGTGAIPQRGVHQFTMDINLTPREGVVSSREDNDEKQVEVK